jgi:hypothetical protein
MIMVFGRLVFISFVFFTSLNRRIAYSLESFLLHVMGIGKEEDEEDD